MTADLYGIYAYDGGPMIDAVLLHHYFKDELDALTQMRCEARRSVDYGKHYAAMMLCIEGGDNTVFTIPSLMREKQPTGLIPINDAQRLLIKEWAADDRLWTTQETVALNLETFARAILKEQ